MQLAQPAFLDQPARGAHFGPLAVLEVDRQQLARRLRRRDHRIGLGHFERHRLLDQHVAARPQAVNRDFGVVVVWRDDDRHVRLQFVDHPPVVGVERHAEHLGALLAKLLPDVAGADQIHDRLLDGGEMHVEDARGDADDGEAQGLDIGGFHIYDNPIAFRLS